MPVPKKRTSHQKRNSRRAHDRLRLNLATTCKSCGAFIQPHRVCHVCGEYKGEIILKRYQNQT